MNQAKPVLQSGSPGKFNNLVGQNFERDDDRGNGLQNELMNDRGYKAATPQHMNTPMHNNSHKRDNASSQGRNARDQQYSNGQSSRSYDSSDQRSMKKEMIRYLSRILDKNKPLFVFNTRLGNEDSENECGTPSFSMITLIHGNEE